MLQSASLNKLYYIILEIHLFTHLHVIDKVNLCGVNVKGDSQDEYIE